MVPNLEMYRNLCLVEAGLAAGLAWRQLPVTRLKGPAGFTSAIPNRDSPYWIYAMAARLEDESYTLSDLIRDG